MYHPQADLKMAVFTWRWSPLNPHPPPHTPNIHMKKFHNTLTGKVHLGHVSEYNKYKRASKVKDRPLSRNKLIAL